MADFKLHIHRLDDVNSGKDARRVSCASFEDLRDFVRDHADYGAGAAVEVVVEYEDRDGDLVRLGSTAVEWTALLADQAAGGARWLVVKWRPLGPLSPVPPPATVAPDSASPAPTVAAAAAFADEQPHDLTPVTLKCAADLPILTGAPAPPRPNTIPAPSNRRIQSECCADAAVAALDDGGDPQHHEIAAATLKCAADLPIPAGAPPPPLPGAVPPQYSRGNQLEFARRGIASFECACGNAFTAPAERTSDFTVDCRQCDRRVRPRAFLPEDVEAPRRYRGPSHGVALFQCRCGNEFTSYAERSNGFTIPCYACGSHVRPARFLPAFDEHRRHSRTHTYTQHSCSVCLGSGHCPVVGASGDRASQRRIVGW
jgi:hypothetical protein